MTLESFLSNNFAEVIGLIFIWIILRKENALDKKDVNKFIAIFYCESMELVVFNLEKVTGFWNEPSILRIILSALGYILRAILVYLFIRYVWPHEKNKKAQTILIIPVVLCVVCGFSPFFTDVVYSFNSTNNFVRGPIGWIFVVVVIGYILLFAYYIIKQRKENERINTSILLLVSFFIITSTLLSTFYDIEWMGRLSIVYGTVFCLFALDANKLKKTIHALQENEVLKQALNEVEIAKKHAEKADRSKTEFLLRMSHDIRTPINGIMGMLDIADTYKDDLNKQDECREKIKDTSKILLELINEVLDMSKLESGEIVLEHVPFDLSEVSKEIYYSVKKLADDRDIEIIQKDCGAANARLVGSPIHLKRLMMNIIGNAIKYNKDHGKIYITCKEIENNGKIMHLEFKCEDTGIGMSPEFMEHIFEPFTQENTTSRTKYAGTGLGMSITKSLVDKMGGTITVESEKGKGSTFDVILPFEIDTSAPTQKLVQEMTENISIKGVNILLVEDNDLNMEIAKFFLEEAGANVTEAWNGQEALDAFKQSSNAFDAILMDVMMPVMDGYAATREIRKLDANIPIIAMTANAFAEDRLASKEAGMNAHISKPLDKKLLIDTVFQFVKNKE